MINGVVHHNEGRIELTVRGPHGQRQVIDAVVDTGCNCFLALSPDVIAALQLPWDSFGPGGLADGTEVLFDVYVATVIWDRKERPIPIVEAGKIALVGMQLLDGYELMMQIRWGGRIRIKRLK